MKQKQYRNKLNKALKTGPHQKKKNYLISPLFGGGGRWVLSGGGWRGLGGGGRWGLGGGHVWGLLLCPWCLPSTSDGGRESGGQALPEDVLMCVHLFRERASGWPRMGTCLGPLSQLDLGLALISARPLPYPRPFLHPPRRAGW